MLQISDEEFLNKLKACDADINTLAEIHKVLNQRSIKCSIEELRINIRALYRDGYIGNEPAEDGINMYYIIYHPMDNLQSPVA